MRGEVALKSLFGRKSFLVVCIFVSCFIFTLPCISSASRENEQGKYRGIVYYVDMDGHNSNDGSLRKPWRTLHYAAGRVKPGDTVLINPGKYIEEKQISIRISGEKEKRITFSGNGKGVIIDLTGISVRNGFEVFSANYITIENLTIHPSRHKHSRGIRLSKSKGSIIRNNIVSGAGHANIFCSHSDYITFENNAAYRGAIGIYVADSSDYVTVKRNLLYNNYLGLHMNGDRHSGGDGTISCATVDSNIIYDNTTGINCDGVTKSAFRNNLLYNNKKRGIAFFVDNGAVPSNDNYVIHNTIIMPQGAYYAIGLNYGANRNMFYNNIILDEGNVPCFSTTSRQNELKIVSDYNLLSRHRRVGEINDRGFTLRKWQDLGYDKHSLQGTITETFVNPEANNYRLNAAGPGIDAGNENHSFGKDILGNIRPNGLRPDIGASEFEVAKRYEIRGKKKYNHKDSIDQQKANLEAEPNESLGEIEKIAKSTKSMGTVDEKKLTNMLGMEFAFVPPGAFIMGVISKAVGESGKAISQQVTLTKGFYMQTTETTQGQWITLMGSNPSFYKKCGKDCPVEQVSWHDVQQFIARLNQAEKTDKYRLPTEAEWEYACRAGTKTLFSFGDCLSTDNVNYCGNHPFRNCQKGSYREMPVSVKDFPSNNWGLSGMHGNVWEWCQDWLGDYAENSVSDPLGPPSGSLRVIRGGGWNSHAKACRSRNRSGSEPTKWFGNLGFRVVMDL